MYYPILKYHDIDTKHARIQIITKNSTIAINCQSILTNKNFFKKLLKKFTLFILEKRILKNYIIQLNIIGLKCNRNILR